MIAQSLRTVAQLARELPAFEERTLRWLIFHAEDNGLSPAIFRIGRRVYIDIDRFNRWLELHRGLQPGTGAPRSIDGPKRRRSRSPHRR